MSSISDFERKLIEAMSEHDEERTVLLQQLAEATVSKRDGTGVGIYVELQVPEGLPKLLKSSRYIEHTPKVHFRHPALPEGGEALLWFKSGTMSTLECYTYDGAWPSEESLFVIESDA